MKPVCVPCQRFFRCIKNGFYFIEAMPLPGVGGPALPGTQQPERWTPYKVWCGDKWRCDGCGTEIVSGVGRDAIDEHYRTEFTDTVKKLGADQLQVNDC